METKNGAIIQELLEKSTVSVKKMRKLLLEIEKKYSKKTKKFSKITRVDGPEASVESRQAEPQPLK